MPSVLKHFAAALTLSVSLWILSLAAILRMDGLRHEPDPLALLAAIGSLFLLPALVLGLWAYASPSLPAWSRGRILLAWAVWIVPVALTVIGVRHVDALAVTFLATIALPLLVLTGFWWERRRS